MEKVLREAGFDQMKAVEESRESYGTPKECLEMTVRIEDYTSLFTMMID